MISKFKMGYEVRPGFERQVPGDVNLAASDTLDFTYKVNLVPPRAMTITSEEFENLVNVMYNVTKLWFDAKMEREYESDKHQRPNPRADRRNSERRS